MKFNKQNFMIDETGDYITLTMNKSGIADYFTKNQTFLDILKYYKPSLNMDKQQRIRAVFYLPNEERHDQKYFMYDIAYACYADKVHVESCLDDMRDFIEWKNKNGYTVDHADSNHRNNTILNLSMMSRKLNSSKSDLVAKFVDPFSIITAYCNGEYRIELRTRINIEMIEKLTISIPSILKVIPRSANNRSIGEGAIAFICEDADHYVACLRWLYDTRIRWCDSENTPRMNQQQNGKLNYWAGNVKSSLLSQRILIEKDNSKFNIFKMECTQNQVQESAIGVLS